MTEHKSRWKAHPWRDSDKAFERRRELRELLEDGDRQDGHTRWEERDRTPFHKRKPLSPSDLELYERYQVEMVSVDMRRTGLTGLPGHDEGKAAISGAVDRPYWKRGGLKGRAI